MAQEGIELVRRIRDNNTITGIAWNTGLSPGTYIMDYDDTGLAVYSGQYLLYNSTNGTYSHNSGSQSPFRRRIQIIAGGGDDLRLDVYVEWTEGTVNKQVILSLRLYNWL